MAEFSYVLCWWVYFTPTVQSPVFLWSSVPLFAAFPSTRPGVSFQVFHHSMQERFLLQISCIWSPFYSKLYYTVYIFHGFFFCCHIIIGERLQMPKQEIMLKQFLILFSFPCKVEESRFVIFKSFEDSQIIGKGSGTRQQMPS